MKITFEEKGLNSIQNKITITMKIGILLAVILVLCSNTFLVDSKFIRNNVGDQFLFTNPFHRYYDCQSYLNRYEDLQKAFGTDCKDEDTREAVLNHYKEFGRNENRDASTESPKLKREADYYDQWYTKRPKWANDRYRFNDKYRYFNRDRRDKDKDIDRDEDEDEDDFEDDVEDKRKDAREYRDSMYEDLRDQLDKLTREKFKFDRDSKDMKKDKDTEDDFETEDRRREKSRDSKDTDRNKEKREKSRGSKERDPKDKSTRTKIKKDKSEKRGKLRH